VIHGRVPDSAAGILGVEPVALGEKLPERVLRRRERVACRPVARLVARRSRARVAPLAAKRDPAVGPFQGGAGVVVREVVCQACADDTRQPGSVEAEEVDAGDPVVCDVCPQVEFRQPDAEPFGEPLRPDRDVRYITIEIPLDGVLDAVNCSPSPAASRSSTVIVSASSPL